MGNSRNRFPARRRFLKQSTVLTASVVALPLPRVGQAAEPADPAAAPAQQGRQAAARPRRRLRDPSGGGPATNGS
jgi:hypothetical protein